MYFSSLEQLKMNSPYDNGRWEKDKLIEYLIQSNNKKFSEYINAFFCKHINDSILADILFDIVLDDDYDGSDAKMGAAYFISKLSENLLMTRRSRLLEAQNNEIYACRPLTYIDYVYEWL